MKNYELLATMDAAIWAKEFMRIDAEHQVSKDEGTMLGWFANAIMTGWDFAKRADATPAVAPPRTALEMAAQDVVTWFEVQRPDLIGPKIERLRELLPPIDWRDAITVVPMNVKEGA